MHGSRGLIAVIVDQTARISTTGELAKPARSAEAFGLLDDPTKDISTDLRKWLLRPPSDSWREVLR